MAKVLVIPTADFSENALDQVTIQDVDCEAVTLDTATMSFNALNQKKTLGYTLTPYNTTDPVSIVSGNTDIITVHGDELTAVGIGTCTVTVTCGEQSAVCTVTSAIAADFIAVGKLRHADASATYYVSKLASDQQGFVCLGRNDADGIPIGVAQDGTAFVISEDITLCPIIIPKNTATIKVTPPTGVRGGKFYWNFFNSEKRNTKETFAPSALTTKSAAYSYSAMVSSDLLSIPFNDVSAIGQTTMNTDVTDSIAITYYNSTAYSSASLGDLITGFTVEFIPVSNS